MGKKITTVGLLLVSVITATFVAWAQNSNKRQTNRLEIVAAERAFARAATKNTRDAFLEFLADDGIIFQPGPVNGKQFWRERPVRKGLLSWEPIYADASRAGDLGYTTGPWEFRPNGPDDKPVAFGQYFTIWKRQADGSWKVALDRGITHPQPPVATERLEFPEEGDVRNKKKADDKADRALLLKLEAEFSRASTSRDTTKAFQSYLAEDVRLFREDSFPVVGKRAALAMVSAKPGVLSWQPTMADISRSSDLGYSYGTYEFKPNSTAVKPEKGNYVRVWKRQAGDKWRVVIDIMNAVPSS